MRVRTSIFRMLSCGAALAGALAVCPVLAQNSGQLGAAQLRPGQQVAQAGSESQPVLLPEPSDPAQPNAAATHAESARSELEAIQNSITLSKARQAELEKKIEELSKDRAERNAELIASAQRVRMAETEVQSIQDKLDGILKSESEVKARLDGADSHLTSLLAALERISQNPPPALIVNPSDALGSARSAMLISAVVPQLRAKAASVSADLKRLDALKQAALAQKNELQGKLQTLNEERLRIATLIEARKQSVDQTSATLDAERTKGNDLASRAAALESLIASLQQRIDAVNTAAKAAREANAGHKPPKLSKQTIEIALANTKRTAPAVPFSAAKGYLDMPVNGTTATPFGADDGFGGTAKGLSLTTPKDARVIAPADGWVLYKGSYLDYGQVVILNAGQGYTFVLAGLDAVSVTTGQFVRMGEPIGTMGNRAPSQTLASGAGVGRPTLYIELRDNDTPIDPDGWWANTNQTQSG